MRTTIVIMKNITDHSVTHSSLKRKSVRYENGKETIFGRLKFIRQLPNAQRRPGGEGDDKIVHVIHWSQLALNILRSDIPHKLIITRFVGFRLCGNSRRIHVVRLINTH